jgi:hypothetical protein
VDLFYPIHSISFRYSTPAVLYSYIHSCSISFPRTVSVQEITRNHELIKRNGAVVRLTELRHGESDLLLSILLMILIDSSFVRKMPTRGTVMLEVCSATGTERERETEQRKCVQQRYSFSCFFRLQFMSRRNGTILPVAWIENIDYNYS